MTIADKSQVSLGNALGSFSASTEICDIIDAGTGTIPNAALRKLTYALGKPAADDFFAIVNAGDGAIASHTLRMLEHACGAVAAADINAGIVANVD